MTRGALLLAGSLLLGGCGRAMTIEVEVSHVIRCRFVHYRGTTTLEAPEEAAVVEECRQAVARVLREWEGRQ